MSGIYNAITSRLPSWSSSKAVEEEAVSTTSSTLASSEAELAALHEGSKAPVEATSNGQATAAPSSSSVEVSGTMTEKKSQFEWNIGRLFSRQEGHSSARTWAVRILSTALVFPVVLTAIWDLARGLTYLAKISDGKSFSLIDETSAACSAIAAKVSSAFSSNKTETREQIREQGNIRSEKAMKGHIAEIVDGYRMQNGGRFHDAGTFATQHAMDGHNQVRAGREKLATEVNSYIARNMDSSGDVDSRRAAILAKVATFFKEAAGNDLFIENKTKYNPSARLISDIGFDEFQASLKAAGSSLVGEQMMGLAEREYVTSCTNPSSSETSAETRHVSSAEAGSSKISAETKHVQTLRKAVNNKDMTPAQAKTYLETFIPDASQRALEVGLVRGTQAREDLIAASINEKLLTVEEAAKIEERTSPTASALGKAAANDVPVNESNSFEIKAISSEKADELIKENRLDPKEKAVFVEAMETQFAAQKTAEQAAQSKKDSEVTSTQTGEAAQSVEAAKKTVAAQKAEAESDLFGDFDELLKIISRKQGALESEFAKFEQLDVERKRLTAVHEEMGNATITVNIGAKARTMNVLEAAQHYNDSIVAINKKENQAPQWREARMKELADQGFDQATVKKIESLNQTFAQLHEITTKQSSLSVQMSTQQEELVSLVAHYNVFAKNNKGDLTKDNVKKVEGLEAPVFAVRKILNQKCEDLLRLKLEGKAEKDKAINRAQVKAINAADKKAPAKTEAEARDEMMPSGPSRFSPAWFGNGAVSLVKNALWTAPYHPLRGLYNLARHSD